MIASLPWQRIKGDREEDVKTAKRVQRFARVTRLRPSTAQYAVFGEACERYPEGADHTLVWHRDRRYVVTTEPYHRSEELEEWCDSHGWAWRVVPALGMWNPPSTVLYVLSPPKNGIPLDQIKAFVGTHHVTTKEEATP